MMPMVWIVETKTRPAHWQATSIHNPIALALVGDFAIRLFGSLMSMRRLAKVEKLKPSIIVVDVETEVLIDKIKDDLDQFFPGVEKLYLVADDFPVNPRTKVAILRRSVDQFVLVSHIKRVFAAQADTEKQHQIRFRDLVFDFARLECQIAEANELATLSLTEGRLLKLLLEHGERYLSRENIRREVWAGVAVSPRTIDSHISRLRKRLAASEVVIEAEYGGGYRLR